MSILSHEQWRRLFGQEQNAIEQNLFYPQDDEWFSHRTQSLLNPNATYWTTEASGIDDVLRNAAKRIEPFWTERPSDIPLTCENLKGAVYDPYFPLVRGSACTHSLTTPSIGTSTTDDEITLSPSDQICPVPYSGQHHRNTPIAPQAGRSPQPSPSAQPVGSPNESNESASDFAPYKLFAPNPFTRTVDAWLKEIHAKHAGGMDTLILP